MNDDQEFSIWQSIYFGSAMMIVGCGMTVLPFVAWKNLSYLALVFSPGVIFGPYLVVLSCLTFGDAFCRKRSK